MPLTFLDETWPGQRVSYQNQFLEGVTAGTVLQVRQHVRFYFYETSDHTEQAQNILTQALPAVPAPPWGNILPRLGDVHPDDQDAIVTHDNVTKNQDSSYHGLIECVYSTAPDPTLLPAKLSYATATVQRAFEGAFAFVHPDGTEDRPGDLTGRYPALAPTEPYPITASNFRPFVPPPADQVPFRVLTAQRNLTPAAWSNWVVNQERNFIQAINSANWVVRGKTYTYNQVYMPQPPAAEEVFSAPMPAQKYFRTTWTFHIDELRGFHLKLADLGFFELKVANTPASGEREIFVNGTRPTQPTRLDGSGQRLALGGATVFLVYRVRRTADFNSLPISPV